AIVNSNAIPNAVLPTLNTRSNKRFFFIIDVLTFQSGCYPNPCIGPFGHRSLRFRSCNDQFATGMEKDFACGVSGVRKRRHCIRRALLMLVPIWPKPQRTSTDKTARAWAVVTRVRLARVRRRIGGWLARSR